MKHRNWFWGFFFLLAAIFVVASQFGSFGHMSWLTILGSILLISMIVHSLIERNYFGVFVPLVFLYMMYRKPLHLVSISVWLLFLAAVLAGMGFSILFKSFPKSRDHAHHGEASFQQSSESMDDNHPYVKVSFGAASRYLHGDCLQSGQFFASFGALEIFFDQAKLSPEGAEIFLDCSFGSIKLYVPKSWKVIDNLRVSLGGVENDTRMARPAEDAPRLTLSGNVQLGGVEIQYI